jgi:hypothetical protein
MVATMSGDAEIQRMIETVQKLGGSATEVAKIAAPQVQAVVQASASKGTTPDGTAWAPKKDGSPALVNAAAAVECRALGTVVQLRLVGTPTGSQKVQAIQNHTRGILPDRGKAIPLPIVGALTKAARFYFNRAMGGR